MRNKEVKWEWRLKKILRDNEMWAKVIRHECIIHEAVNLLPAIVKDINLCVSSGSTEGNKENSMTDHHSLHIHTTWYHNLNLKSMRLQIISLISYGTWYTFDNCNLITTNETEYSWII